PAPDGWLRRATVERSVDAGRASPEGSAATFAGPVGLARRQGRLPRHSLTPDPWPPVPGAQPADNPPRARGTAEAAGPAAPGQWRRSPAPFPSAGSRGRNTAHSLRAVK